MWCAQAVMCLAYNDEVEPGICKNFSELVVTTMNSWHCPCVSRECSLTIVIELEHRTKPPDVLLQEILTN